MKNNKRIIAFMLSIVLIMGVYTPIEAAVTPTQFTTANGIGYSINSNNEIVITEYSGSSANMVIPESIDGKTVTSIGNEAFFENDVIESVEFPETLKEIGRMAFLGCENIDSIELPKNLEWIGVCAFQMCCSLKKVIIYENTELEKGDIGNRIFSSYADGFKIYGYKDSPAEAYSKIWNDPFVYNDWVPLTDITLPQEITVNISEKTEIPVTFTPEDSYVGFHKADEYLLTGNGDAVIEITEDGKVYITATEVGQDNLSLTKYAEFRYIDNNITSNVCKINIVDPSIIDATSLSITDKDGNVLSDAEKVVDTYKDITTIELKAVMTPTDASEIVTYESDTPYVASVSQVDGIWTLQVYTSKTDKVAIITATSNRTGQTSSFTIKSTYSGARDLIFNTDNVKTSGSGEIVNIVNHGSYSLPLVVTPSALSTEIAATVSDESVLTYDASTGTITPLKAGTATISASVRGKSCSKTVVISEYELNATSIAFATDNKLKSSGSDYTLAMNINDTYKIVENVLPVGHTDILKWYYDKKYLSVEDDGTIKVLKEGTTTLYAYTVSWVETNIMKSVSGNIVITITDPNKVVDDTPEVILAKDIQLGQNDCQMNVGEKLQLTAALTPSNTTEKPTFKSSDTSIAKVSDKGLITIVGTGTVNIIAQIRGILDIIEITVKAPIIPPTLSLSTSSITLKKGETGSITGTITGNTNVTSIIWNVEDVTMASITENGEITAKSAGNTRIEGLIYCFDTSSYYRTYCTLTITEDAPTTPTTPSTPTSPATPSTPTTPTTVQGIAMNTSSLVLDYGDANTLVAALYPQGVSGTVSWTSNNEGVAEVSNGLVVAKGPGTCQIVATCNGITATSNVTVNPGTIQLNAGKFNLQKGKTTKALIVSASSYENDKIVSVTSSNSKILRASVSNNQISLKGIKTSSKYVTVTVQTESGASATCQVKVVKDKVTTSKLILNKKTVTISKGASETLAVTQTPISSTDKLTWTCSNKKVATVNKNGKIVAKKKGKATITLKSSNGKKVTCKVTVK